MLLLNINDIEMSSVHLSNGIALQGKAINSHWMMESVFSNIFRRFICTCEFKICLLENFSFSTLNYFYIMYFESGHTWDHFYTRNRQYIYTLFASKQRICFVTLTSTFDNYFKPPFSFHYPTVSAVFPFVSSFLSFFLFIYFVHSFLFHSFIIPCFFFLSFFFFLFDLKQGVWTVDNLDNAVS